MRSRRMMGALSLVAVFGLVAAGCGSSKKASSDTTAAPVQETTTSAAPAVDTTAPPAATTAPAETPKTIGLLFDVTGRGDKSFNDAAAAGLDKAKAEFKVEGKESTPSGDADRAERMNAIIGDKVPLIIANGYLWGDAITAGAKANPDTKFAIIDSVVDAPNVSSLVFAANEGSFLAGVVAATKSTTGHIGFVGGMEIDLIKAFEAGFLAGAKAVKPDIKIDSAYAGPAGDTTAFNNPAKGKELALAMFEGGADIVYHASGGTGIGVFEAAKEFSAKGKKVWTIGVDSDQYITVPDAKDFILTSALKKVDVAVYETIKDFVTGNFKAGVRNFDLKSGGVGLSTSGGYIDDMKSVIDEWTAKITSGALVVPSKP